MTAVRNSDGTITHFTPEEEVEYDERSKSNNARLKAEENEHRKAAQSKNARNNEIDLTISMRARLDELQDVANNVVSVPQLRAVVQDLIEILRGPPLAKIHTKITAIGQSSTASVGP